MFRAEVLVLIGLKVSVFGFLRFAVFLLLVGFLRNLGFEGFGGFSGSGGFGACGIWGLHEFPWFRAFLGC